MGTFWKRICEARAYVFTTSHLNVCLGPKVNLSGGRKDSICAGNFMRSAGRIEFVIGVSFIIDEERDATKAKPSMGKFPG